MRTLARASAFLLFALVLLGQASLILAWLPSASYVAVAAGTNYFLVDNGSGTPLRGDQLSAVGSVLGTDTFPDCQSCSAGTTILAATGAQIATYVSSVMTAAANVWTAGQEMSPHALTNASMIAVDLSTANVQTITLSASGQTIGCPTGLTSGKWETVSFIITQPSSAGPDDLKWDTCYQFPSGTPPRQSNNGLSAANNAADMVTCNVLNTAGTYTGLCPFGGSNNFASSSQFVLRTNHVNSGSACSGASATTCSVTILNSMANDLRVVAFESCCQASQGAPTSVTDGTNACTVDSASFNNGATGNAATGIAYCPQITGSASASVTVTWPQSTSFNFVSVQEFVPSVPSPLAGIGNKTSGTTGANPSISTNGSTSQAGQLVVAIMNDGGNPTASTCTLIGTPAVNTAVAYSLPAPIATATCGFTAASSNFDGSITSFTHY